MRCDFYGLIPEELRELVEYETSDLRSLLREIITETVKDINWSEIKQKFEFNWSEKFEVKDA